MAVLVDGMVVDDVEDASMYPVPSGNGSICSGVGNGRWPMSSGSPGDSRAMVVTSAALPRRPTLALLTSPLSSSSSISGAD